MTPLQLCVDAVSVSKQSITGLVLELRVSTTSVVPHCYICATQMRHPRHQDDPFAGPLLEHPRVFVFEKDAGYGVQIEVGDFTSDILKVKEVSEAHDLIMRGLEAINSVRLQTLQAAKNAALAFKG